MYLGDLVDSVFGGTGGGGVMQTYRVKAKLGVENQLREAHYIQEQVLSRAIGTTLMLNAKDGAGGVVVPPALDALCAWQPRSAGALSPHCEVMLDSVGTILKHRSSGPNSESFGSDLFKALTFFLAPSLKPPEGTPHSRIKEQFRKSYNHPATKEKPWVHSAQCAQRTVHFETLA